MILSSKTIEYFKKINSLMNQCMVNNQYPYMINGDFIFNIYESIRCVWLDDVRIQDACDQYNISRSSYYLFEKQFVEFGLPGIFSLPRKTQQFIDLEHLVLMVKKARPSLSYTAIFRIAESISLTKDIASPALVSSILNSHGYGLSNMKNDIIFWERIQRTLKTWERLIQKKISVMI